MDPLDEVAAAALGHAGERIRHLRDQCGWSLDELALRCALPVDDLRAVETGRVDLGLSELARLAAVLEVPLSALVS